MRKSRNKQIAILLLCISVILSSLQPAGVVHAENQQGAAEGPEASASVIPADNETDTPAPAVPAETPSPEPEETELPTPAADSDISPTPTELPVPGMTPDKTDFPTVTPSPSGSGIPEEIPVETGTPTPTAALVPTGTPTVTPTQTPTPTPTQTPTPTASAADLNYILGRPMTEEEIAKQMALVPANLPLLPEEETVEGYDGGIALFAIQEEQYDSRDYGYITSVKNQNPYGSCWTYATMASLESSLIVSGVAEASLDLSEWHLAYYATHTGSDELGNTKGDYVKPFTDTTVYMDNGGNAYMSAVALSNWKGAALEEDYPGSSDRDQLAAAGNELTPEDAWKNNAYYMSNCYLIPASDTETVKTFIKQFGAVFGTYYHHNNYYNWNTAAYFYDGSPYSNHAITLVGWDDTYSKDNFLQTAKGNSPEGDGAWICKNSWGSAFGDEGYFYISYYDSSLTAGNIAAFDAKEAESDRNNYYYGGGVDIGTYILTTGIAQCYTAHANEGGAESIEGVGFLTRNSGVSYTVQVYKNPDSEQGIVCDPESGEAMFDHPQQGITDYAGYHSIEFSQPVTVEEGDVFSVVISFDDSIGIYMDYNHLMNSGGVEPLYDSVNLTAEGESFIKPEAYHYYIDASAGKDNGYTPRMNVFTRDTEGAFCVYLERPEGREVLGSFGTWEKAVSCITETGNEDADYTIEIVRNVSAGEFQMPEGIHSLTVLGNAAEGERISLKIGDQLSVACSLTIKDMILLPEEEVSILTNDFAVRLENTIIEEKHVKQILGGGLKNGSFYTDSDLEVTGDVTKLSLLTLAGNSVLSARTMEIGDLYLSVGASRGEGAECRISGTAAIENIINENEDSILTVTADLNTKTCIWTSKLAVNGDITGNPIQIRLMGPADGENADNWQLSDGNYYRPLAFFVEEKNEEGQYYFRSNGSGIYMQFYLAKLKSADINMIKAHSDNCLPFGGNPESYVEANYFKISGNLVYKNQVKTVVLSYQNNGQAVLTNFASFQDAITEINSLKVKRDYTLTLMQDIISVSGDSIKPSAFSMPRADCVSSLTIEGNGKKICFTGNTITAVSDLTLRDVTLVPLKANPDKETKALEPFIPIMDERAAGYLYPAAVTLKAGGHSLRLEGQIKVEGPLLLNGGKGTLKIEGTVYSAGYTQGSKAGSYVCSGADGLDSGIAGSITDFKEVFLAENLSLRCYYTAAGKRTGGLLTAVNVEQMEDVWIQGKVTADYLYQADHTALLVGIEEGGTFTALKSDAVIKDYRASEGCSCMVTGKFTSAVKAGLYGGRTEPVTVKAEKIAFNSITLSHAKVTAQKDFTITGVLVSETQDNQLVTSQKADTKGKITGVFLTINGTVLLSEDENQIEINVKEADGEKDAGLCNAPSAEGILLNAKTAGALCFRPAEINCIEEQPKLVKNGTKVYLYYAGEAPVEVNGIVDGKETFLGFFPSLAEAAKAVDARKDKEASYIFSLHDSLGQPGKPEKIVLPVNASELTVRASEETGENIVLYTANDIVLKTDTTLENITLSPEYGKGMANVNMGRYRLTLKKIKVADHKMINKITSDTKSTKALELIKEETDDTVIYGIGTGGIAVAELILGQDTELVVSGKASIGVLSMGESAVLTIEQKGSVITDIADYSAFVDDDPDRASKIRIKLNADLTIRNSVADKESGALLIEKEGVQEVGSLKEITAGKRILTAPKAAASSFKICDPDSLTGRLPFKHEQGIYLPEKNAENNGLLQVSLAYGEAAARESRFVDWYQAITEINTLNDRNMCYELMLLQDIDITRRVDGKSNEIISPGGLLLPSPGKCSTLSVIGEGRKLCFTGNLAVNQSCIFREVSFEPVKISKGAIVPATADIAIKTGLNGSTALTFDQCGPNIGSLTAGSIPKEILFGNIKGDGKNCEVYLINGSSFHINGNVNGLKGLFLGMNEEGQAAGRAVLGISGKVEVKILGLMGEGRNWMEDTRLLVTGRLAADTLKGQDGTLMVKQTSGKNNDTDAIIKGGNEIPEGNAMTVLVMQPDIKATEIYLQKLDEKENPFVVEPVGIPLLQAPVLPAEKIRTARVTLSDSGDLQSEQLEGVVYYRDIRQYIRAGLTEKMQIRVTARSENGMSASSYAESWYEAVQMLDSMGNHYTWYGLELLGDNPVKTGFHSKTGEAVTGKFLLPSKVKGTIEISRAQDSGASLVYTGDMKVPDKLELIVKGVPFEQVDTKGNIVTKGVTIGSGAALKLVDEPESCMELSKIAAPKGSLWLDQTKVCVEGKAEIKALYVSDGENTLTGRGEMKIHSILPFTEDAAGRVILSTVSKYSKTKSGYTMTQLSQLSINGSVERNVEAGLQIWKDPSKIQEGEGPSYTAEELLVGQDEAVSVKKRLAAVAGNAADGRIVLLDGAGNSLSGKGKNYLFTEAGGLYLGKEAPLLTVYSQGGTYASQYEGSFRTVEAALKAVSVSAKEDTSLSKNNRKSYELVFERQPETAVALSMPANVEELCFRYSGMDDSRICLTFKGSLSLKSSTVFCNMDLASADAKGNPAAASINAGNYRLTLEQSGLSERISLKGGAKGELLVTGTGKEEIKTAALQGFLQVTVRDAGVMSSGNITIQNVQLQNAVLKGRNITISKKTEMKGSTISAAADDGTASGKLKLFSLYSLNKDQDQGNVLAAKQDAKGKSGLEITGKVFTGQTGEKDRFEVRLYQTGDHNVLADFQEKMVLLTAPSADGNLFVPAYSASEDPGMGSWQEGYGVYKSGKTILYGEIEQAEAVLVNTISVEDEAAPLGSWYGGTTTFLSLEEAVAEINSRKDKTAVYIIELVQGAEIRNTKGVLTSLALPSNADKVTIKGTGSEQADIKYTGNISLKCNTTFENVKLTSYKVSGKNMVVSDSALSVGNYELGIAKAVGFGGSLKGGRITLEDGAELTCVSVKATNLSCEGRADLYISRGNLITITGLLKPASIEGNITIHLDYSVVPNGTRIIEIKSLRGKADLMQLRVEDNLGKNDYILYQDGRAVYCRK